MNDPVSKIYLTLSTISKLKQSGIIKNFAIEVNSGSFVLEESNNFAVSQSSHVSVVFSIHLFLYVFLVKGLQIVNSYYQIKRGLSLKI